jgi:drug/metabolite transporter superfamily protein YnfA
VSITQMMLTWVASLLAYSLIGPLAFRMWIRRRGPCPASYSLEPAAWFTYWFPMIIASELYALVGATCVVLLICFFWPLEHYHADVFDKLGFALGLGSYAVMSFALDVWLAVRSRRSNGTAPRRPPANS